MLQQIFLALFRCIKITIWSVLKALFTILCFFIPQLQPIQGKYGSARWLSWFERKQLLSSRHKGFIIDGKQKLPAKLSYQHLTICAPTGRGKTTCFCIPHILNTKEGSLIVTDPSGEIFKTTSGYLAKQGYKIKVLSMEGKQTLTYNPLHRAQSSRDINKLATILIQSANPDKKGDTFWTDGAKSILSILISALKNVPAKYQNLANVRYLLNNFGVDGSPINEFMVTYADEITHHEYKGFLSNDEKVLSGFVSSARVALEAFTDQDLATLTATETLHFESLRQRKTALFIQVPEQSVQYYSFLITILYTQIFDFLMSDTVGTLPVTILMDEFGNMGKLPNIATIMTTIRKRKVAIALILQDLQQLSATYGYDQASVILNGGTASRLFFGGLSIKSCEEISRLLGTATMEEHHLLHEEKIQQYGRRLMTPDEIRMLPDGEALFIHGNLAPLKVQMTPWYRNRRLRRRTKYAPFHFQKGGDRVSNIEFVPLSCSERSN